MKKVTFRWSEVCLYESTVELEDDEDVEEYLADDSTWIDHVSIKEDFQSCEDREVIESSVVTS